MEKTKPKNYRAMERIIKGFGNHRRLQILDMLARESELTVEDIAARLKIGYENTSDHIRKMAIAGLVAKRYNGRFVCHKLTPRGENIQTICKMFE